MATTNTKVIRVSEASIGDLERAVAAAKRRNAALKRAKKRQARKDAKKKKREEKKVLAWIEANKQGKNVVKRDILKRLKVAKEEGHTIADVIAELERQLQ